MAQPVHRPIASPEGNAPTPVSRRRTVMRTLLATVALPVVLGLAVVLVLVLTPWGNERVRRIVISQANGRLNGELAVGSLRGNLLTGATLTDVRLTDSARRPLFSARRVRLRYALGPALRGRLVLRSLVADTPVVVLDKQPGARWNFQSLLRPSGPRDSTRHRVPPELADITIHHGRFVYRRPWRPDTTLTADRRDSAIAVALGGKSRSLVVRVPGGFQRVVEYHDIDARLPSVRFARDGRPTAVEIAALSMIGEPYREPAIDVRSLIGTLYASRDSLWWRGARMALPNSRVSGDGTIKFRRLGFWLDLRGTPIAFADLRWVNPRMPASGGGTLRYAMRIHGDTTSLSMADAKVRYREATVAGRAALTRIHPKGETTRIIVEGADLALARLGTDIIRELAPALDVRRRGALNGHVAITGPRTDARLDADITFDDASAGRSRVIARGGVVLGADPRARDLAIVLRPLQVASLAGTAVRLPVRGTLTGTATVSGSRSSGWRGRGDLVLDDRRARSRVVGNGRWHAVSGRIAADARLAPLSLTTLNGVVPAARLRGMVTGRVRADGTTRDVRFATTLRSTTGGAIDVRGTVSPRGSRTRYDLVAVTDALDASAFTRRAPSTRFTGTIVARGSGFAATMANAVVRADLASSRYDTLRVDRLSARLALANGVARIDTLTALASGARVDAGGSLGIVAGRNGTLQFSARVDSLGALRAWLGTRDTGSVAAPAARRRALLAAARADSLRRADAVRIERLALGLPEGVELVLDTLPALPPLRRDSLSGSLAASGALLGSLKQLGVDARVTGSGLVAHGNVVHALEGEVSGAVRGEVGAPLRFRFVAEGVEASGRAFERLDANGQWRDRALAGAVRVRQDSLVSYALAGSYSRPERGATVVRVDSLRATFDTLVWRLTHPGAVRLASGSVSIDSIELRSSAGGRLFASGSVPREGPASLDVAAEHVRVGTVLRALQREADGDGEIGATAHLSGTRTAPVVDGRATLRGATWQGARTPDVELTLGHRERRTALDAVARDSAGRRVLRGTASLPYDLALARVEGSRRLDGPLTADVTLDSLSLAALPLRSRSVADVRGFVGAEVQVRGSWRAPTYHGRAAVRGGGLTLAAIGMRIGDAVADLSLTGDTLRLDSLVARAGGPVRASGIVDLTDASRPFVRANASGEDVRVMDQRRGEVDANGVITAVGPLDELHVTGRGEMLRGFLALKQFRKDLLRVKSPGELSFVTVFDTTASARDSARIAMARRERRRLAMVVDLTLVIDRGNYYRNRPDANTEFSTVGGEAVVAHLDQRSDDKWAVGFVRIPGGVAYFRTQSFASVRGSLTFTPHTNAVGIVQQVGERLLWEPGRGWLPLQFFTGGTSKVPAVGLESGTLFPIRGRELNGYLTQGRTATSLLQQSGSSLSGSASWSGQLSGEVGALARRQQGATALGVVLHDIGTGATKEWDFDAFGVSPADVPTELVFGKTGGVRGALVEGGRYFTTERYIAAQMRLTTGIPGFRLAQRFGTTYRLDVGLEPRFLFRAPAELGITHPTIRTGVFGAFLTRMWDF
jgi:autotransporter translocation and assembly factor TamB